jgi:ABC-type transporter Mla subunit MlaD
MKKKKAKDEELEEVLKAIQDLFDDVGVDLDAAMERQKAILSAAQANVDSLQDDIDNRDA